MREPRSGTGHKNSSADRAMAARDNANLSTVVNNCRWFVSRGFEDAYVEGLSFRPPTIADGFG